MDLTDDLSPGSLDRPVKTTFGGQVWAMVIWVSSLNKGTRAMVSFFERSRKVFSPSLTVILAELSMIMTNRASCSAASHPGIKPWVTGWAIIKTKDARARILNNSNSIFWISILRMELVSSCLINRTVLNSTLLIRRRLNRWIRMGILTAPRSQRTDGVKNVIEAPGLPSSQSLKKQEWLNYHSRVRAAVQHPWLQLHLEK